MCGGGSAVGRKPIKYHICIKMPSPGSPRRARYFGDSYLKAVEVWALHAGIAPWHRLHYLWASSLFYWFTGGWGRGAGSVQQSSMLLERHVPNDVTGLVGAGRNAGENG